MDQAATTTRILVVYGTSEGQTRKVAVELSIALRRAGAEVDVHPASPAAPGPAQYAGIVVAASVHVGKYQRPVRNWILQHAASLRGKPAVFISVCLAVLDPNPEAQRRLAHIMRTFVEDCGWSPAYLKPVAGALAYTKYGWLTRWVMKRIAAKMGGDTDTSRDYEYTDWADLRAFAREFLVAINVKPRVASSLAKDAQSRPVVLA